jgi:uncharacterized protein YjdB
MKKSRILTFFMALCSIGMAGCVKYNGVPQESPIKLELSQDDFELIKGDGGKTFIPKLSSTEEEITNNKVSIEVKDKKIVSVDKKEVASGDPVRITALNYGSTTITVTSKQDKDCKGTIKVKVVKVPAVIHVTDLEVSVDSIDLIEEETAQIGVDDGADIKYTVLPENANTKDVVISATPSSVVSVDENGLVTALSEGEGKITITTVDSHIEKEITVNVSKDQTLVVGNMYLVGTQTDWKPVKAYEMTANPTKPQEYMITITSHVDEEVQMVKYNGEGQEYSWYNARANDAFKDFAVLDGSGNNLLLKKDGRITIYVDTQDVEGGHYKYWVTAGN